MIIFPKYHQKVPVQSAYIRLYYYYYYYYYYYSIIVEKEHLLQIEEVRSPNPALNYRPRKKRGRGHEEEIYEAKTSNSKPSYENKKIMLLLLLLLLLQSLTTTKINENIHHIFLFKILLG